MRKPLLLFLASVCFTASAQIEVEYPYNPDFENDGFVGIEDVLELLSVYGTPFTPEQLLLDGASLTEIIESLQSQIDSLASYTNEGFGGIALNDSLLTEYLVGVAAASEEGDSTLGAWVMQLSEVVEQQQAQLDSLTAAEVVQEFQCGDTLEYFGEYYPTVELNGECWFAKNLAYLPEVFPPDDLSDDSLRFYVWDYFGLNYEEEAVSSVGFEEFGVFYNAAAVESNSICPSGWHVSGYYEWKSMLHSLAYEYVGSTPNFYTPIDLLDDNSGWNLNNTGDNRYGEFLNGTGFAIKPASAVNLGSSTPFYSSGDLRAYFGCQNPTGRIDVESNHIYLYDSNFLVNKAVPVRCVKD